MSQSDTSFRAEQEATLQGPFTQAELGEAVAEFRSRGIMWADPRDLSAAMERNREAKRMQAEAEAREKAAKAETDVLPAETHAKPKRKRGRPQKCPWWLPDLAESHTQGIPMLRALRKVGQGDLSVAERKNIYRWKRFRQLVASLAAKYGMR
jgi:hypothetical protein